MNTANVRKFRSLSDAWETLVVNECVVDESFSYWPAPDPGYEQMVEVERTVGYPVRIRFELETAGLEHELIVEESGYICMDALHEVLGSDLDCDGQRVLARVIDAAPQPDGWTIIELAIEDCD